MNLFGFVIPMNVESGNWTPASTGVTTKDAVVLREDDVCILHPES